ncbi:MAG: hypothetical protein WCF85_13095 [Rhodospirillaceae bacterium]
MSKSGFMIVAIALSIAMPSVGQAASGQAFGSEPTPVIMPPTKTLPEGKRGGEARMMALPRINVSDPQSLTLDFDVERVSAEAAKRGTLAKYFDSAWYWITSIFTDITNGLTPPSPESFTKTMSSLDPDDFWSLVGDAGYKLLEISTDVGVVPDLGFHFKHQRELSEGDINWLERILSHHAEKHTDPLSFIQRTIIYTLLNINNGGDYFVRELKVKLLPLPTVRFSLVPIEIVMTDEHTTLMRAIEGKKPIRRRPPNLQEDSHY